MYSRSVSVNWGGGSQQPWNISWLQTTDKKLVWIHLQYCLSPSAFAIGQHWLSLHMTNRQTWYFSYQQQFIMHYDLLSLSFNFELDLVCWLHMGPTLLPFCNPKCILFYILLFNAMSRLQTWKNEKNKPERSALVNMAITPTA